MEGLGLNLPEFIYQLINFVLLFAVLTYLLHKPLRKLIDDRKKEIEQSLAAADKMKKEVAESEGRQKTLLEKARQESAQVLEDAREQAKELSRQLEEETGQKVSDLLSRTEEEIKSEKERLKTELRQELAALVVKASEKVLETKLDTKEEQARAAALLEKL